MTAADLLAYLRGRGVELWPYGDRLRYSAPKGVMTPAVRSELTRCRKEILTLLGQGRISRNSTSLSLQPISRDGGLSLSFAQERLWLLHQLEPNSPAYNISLAVRLTGPLKVAALEQSINEIVRRHEVLRTTCSFVDGRAIQIIAPDLALKMPVLDLRGLPKAGRECEVMRAATEEARRPFDLGQGPLLRIILLWLSEEEYVLLLTLHHFVADGWSMGVLYRELSTLYEAFSAGKPSLLPDLPVQYADFAHWQRQWLQGEVLEKQLAYWREQLAGAPVVLELPTDRPRPPVETHRGATQSFMFPMALSEGLRALSRQEEATLFMTLLAAFQALLYRYVYQDRIVIGTAVSTRNRIEIEGLIGSFANNLLLCADLSGNPTFRELLGRVRNVALEAYAHQDLPFGKLLEELKPELDLSRNPLFQVMFSLHRHAPEQDMKIRGLAVRGIPVEMGTSRFDLSLEMLDMGGELSGTVEYSTDLFDAATIDRMLGHFGTLLAGIVADPDQSISTLPILTEAERRQLLVEWNNMEIDCARDRCLHELFETQVKQTPDAVAAVFEEQQLTYRELNARANQLAHHLRRHGVGPEVLVGICVERSLEMLVGLLGILKAGGAYVPLDPVYPRERLTFMLEDTQAPVLVTQQRLLEGFAEYEAKIVCLDAHWEAIAREPEENPVSGATARNLAYLIYTSGSTGKPKGVQIPHGAVVNFLNSMGQEPGLTDQDRLLAVTTLSFDIAVLELFLPIAVGACIVIVRREVAFDGISLSKQLLESGITVMQAPPSIWQFLLDSGWQGNRQLKMLCGGEVLPQELAHQLLGRGHSLWNLYGPTETTVWSTVHRVGSQQRTIPIGHPIANTQIHILDAHLQPVPIGVPGELYIGGPGLARGYLNRSKLTAERFPPNPFADKQGDRLYRTGDLARYLCDGNIEFLGRMDHQVKLRGIRIEPGEIETVLRQHPTIREAVVTARNDPPGGKHLVAYVVSSQELVPKTGELLSFLKEKLPDYMVPSAFVWMDRLPLTPNGKVDRHALPAPDRTRLDLEGAYVAPRTPIQEMLAGIWAEVLGLERVGIHDSFFELGGHSLLAMQIISRVRDALQVELRLAALFQAPTIVQLAHVLRRHQGAPL